jgi:hypothetical protein
MRLLFRLILLGLILSFPLGCKSEPTKSGTAPKDDAQKLKAPSPPPPPPK